MEKSLNDTLDLKILPQFLIRYKINIFSTNGDLITDLISKLGSFKNYPILRTSHFDEEQDQFILSSSTQIVSFIYSSFKNPSTNKCLISYTKTVLNSNSIINDNPTTVLYLSNIILFLIDKSVSDSLKLIKQYYKHINEPNKYNYFLIVTNSSFKNVIEISDNYIDSFKKKLPIHSKKFNISLQNGKTLIPLKTQLDKYFFEYKQNNEEYNNSSQINFLNFNRYLYFTSEKEQHHSNMGDYPKLNILLLGNSLVGKTCFFHKLFTDRYFESIMTIGIEYRQMIVKIKDTKCKVSIWDTGGQEKFKSTLFTTFSKMDAFLLFFALDDMKSFEDIKEWFNDIEEQKGKIGENIPLILIGNKWDLHDQRVVEYSDAVLLAKNNDVRYIEISSLTGLNVYETIISMLCLSQKVLLLKEELTSFSLKKNRKEIKKGMCC